MTWDYNRKVIFFFTVIAPWGSIICPSLIFSLALQNTSHSPGAAHCRDQEHHPWTISPGFMTCYYNSLAVKTKGNFLNLSVPQVSQLSDGDYSYTYIQYCIYKVRNLKQCLTDNKHSIILAIWQNSGYLYFIFIFVCIIKGNLNCHIHRHSKSYTRVYSVNNRVINGILKPQHMSFYKWFIAPEMVQRYGLVKAWAH